MSAEISKCYELLGVKPGVSAAELKAAYRDMAKVWHPDRFGHDERLQKKAQEKLKEINEAYEALISGKTPRPKPNSSASDRRDSTSRENDFNNSRSTYTATNSPTSPKSFSWSWVVVPLLIFGAVFFVASRSLLRSSQIVENTGSTERANSVEATAQNEAVRESASETSSRNRNRAEPESQSPTKPSENPSTQTSSAPLQPMKTVTVLIDPSTGLVARAECPTKTRMTYPAGNEPQGACTAAHASKTQASGGSDSNESRAKTFAKRVATPGKWLGGSDKD